MAARPTGFGLTPEIESKYDVEQEQEARVWIEKVIGESIGSADPNDPLWMDCFHECLKDGLILCRLVSMITGEAVRTNDTQMAFKQMENIGNFLEACENYGVLKTDLFMAVVVSGLHALGRKSNDAGYQGPTLVSKTATENVRQLTDEQHKAGQGVIGPHMGKTSGVSMNKPRFIMD